MLFSPKQHCAQFGEEEEDGWMDVPYLQRFI